tara:strand:+ start:352 stop:549 length:198 start_codon:yes stop_codon:yes gene_type:complete
MTYNEFTKWCEGQKITKSDIKLIDEIIQDIENKIFKPISKIYGEEKTNILKDTVDMDTILKKLKA